MTNSNLKRNTVITCIIPAYNEEKNIARVLKVVTKYHKFDEIIIIDDGSKDNTVNIIKQFQKNYKKLKLLQNEVNLGKTAGVKRGIKYSEGNLIVLLDADLIDLTQENLDSLILPVMYSEVSQTILDRAGDRVPLWGWTNCARFFGGERCFWKQDFQDIKIPDSGGYLLEIVTNLHYIYRERVIRTIFCENLYTVHQYNKVSKLQGTWNYFKMSYKIVKKSGIINFIRQILWIEEDRFSIMYKAYRKLFYIRPVIGIIIVITNLLDGIWLFAWLNVKPLLLILEKWSLKPKYYVKAIKNWWLTR